MTRMFMIIIIINNDVVAVIAIHSVTVTDG